MKKNKYRDHYCGNLTEDNINEHITVSGWVDSVRDHGGILFLDLRDSEGVLQVTSQDNNMFVHLNKESVVRVTGTVRKRDEDDYNDKIKTGTIELVAEKVEVISKCQHVLPFEIKTSRSVSDEIQKCMILLNYVVNYYILFVIRCMI